MEMRLFYLQCLSTKSLGWGLSFIAAILDGWLWVVSYLLSNLEWKYRSNKSTAIQLDAENIALLWWDPYVSIHMILLGYLLPRSIL